MTSPLTCPKCGSEMRSYERNQVVVDQCTGCGGLFLDRGELERLITAESAFYAQPDRGQAPPPAEPHRERPREDHRKGDQGYRSDQGYRKKKSKRGFLEDLLDF